MNTLSFKHSRQESSTDRTPQTIHRKAVDSPQLALFDASPAKAKRSSGRQLQRLALYATPSPCKQPGSGHWWNIYCDYNRKMFGGLYSVTERDKILKAFDGRTDQITAREFGAVAERVIAETHGKEVRS